MLIRKSPERPYVKASKQSMYSGEKLYLNNKPLKIGSKKHEKVHRKIK